MAPVKEKTDEADVGTTAASGDDTHSEEDLGTGK